MKRKRFVPQKEVINVYCEGKTEVNLFIFLKSIYSNKRVKFHCVKDMGGCDSLIACKEEHRKFIRGLALKPKKQYKNVKMLYILDNDLAESLQIKEYLTGEGCSVQLCDPNTEGMIMSIIKMPVKKEVGDDDYRAKCKNAFKDHFECEAHELKEAKLKEIFNVVGIVQIHLPVLYALFIK